eukprot:834217-Lingulodinium_polyedra.AAC.1
MARRGLAAATVVAQESKPNTHAGGPDGADGGAGGGGGGFGASSNPCTGTGSTVAWCTGLPLEPLSTLFGQSRCRWPQPPQWPQ